MKKILSLLLSATMVSSVIVLPTVTASAEETSVAQVVFEEDFNDGAKTFINQTTEGQKTAVNATEAFSRSGANARLTYHDAYASNGASQLVETTADGALHYKSINKTAGEKGSLVTLHIIPSGTAEDLRGKRVVIETKTKTSGNQEYAYLAMLSDNDARKNGSTYLVSSRDHIVTPDANHWTKWNGLTSEQALKKELSEEQVGHNYYNKPTPGGTNISDDYHTIKTVIDLTGDGGANNPDTYRVYVDGYLIGTYARGYGSDKTVRGEAMYDYKPTGVKKNAPDVQERQTKLEDKLASIMFGGKIPNANAKGGTFEQWIDYVKVTAIDDTYKFTVTPATAAGSVINNGTPLVFNFTQPVVGDLAKADVKFVNADTGADVAADIVWSNDDKTVTVTPKSVAAKTNYNVVFGPAVADQYGIPLKSKYSPYGVYYGANEDASLKSPETTFAYKTPEATVVFEENFNYDNQILLNATSDASTTVDTTSTTAFTESGAKIRLKGITAAAYKLVQDKITVGIENGALHFKSTNERATATGSSQKSSYVDMFLVPKTEMDLSGNYVIIESKIKTTKAENYHPGKMTETIGDASGAKYDTSLRSGGFTVSNGNGTVLTNTMINTQWVKKTDAKSADYYKEEQYMFLQDSLYNTDAREKNKIGTDAWHTVTIVMDLTGKGDSTDPDRYRVYLDGNLRSGRLSAYGKDASSTKDKACFGETVYDFGPSNSASNYKLDRTLKAIAFGGKTVDIGKDETTSVGEQWIDSVKITSVADSFSVTAPSVDFDPANPALTYTFNRAAAANIVNDIKVLAVTESETTEVTGSNAVLSNDGITLTVTPNVNQIPVGATDVKVVFGPAVADTYGIPLKSKYSPYGKFYGQGVTTAETVYTYKVAANVNGTATGTVTNGTFAGTVTITNPTSAQKDIWYAVAAFDKNNRMLNVQTGTETTIDANGTITNANISLTGVADAATVKLFVWNGAATMTPYQDVQPVWTASN